jgi:leader peptidase (prepilin peptidase)/N-methyltransferase
MTDLLGAFQEHPWFFYVTVALMGLCVGSFLNVVIYRLPKMMEAQWRAECASLAGEEPKDEAEFNLLQPASRCTSCGTPIKAWHNVPVAGWLVLGGKCANCKAPISFRYPAIELTAGVLALAMAWRFGPSVALLGALVFVWALLALTFIDLDTQLLPDDITLPLLWAGLLANLFGAFTDLRSAVIGAVAGYMILWLVYWGFRLIARKEGMGYGDFKLLAALGAWLGWQMLPFVIVVSAGAGAIVGGLLLWLSKSGMQTRIPFGPYLALGGLAGLLWGRAAVAWWLGYVPG